jgi:cytochrome b pre-mRNA-processing protein 3
MVLSFFRRSRGNQEIVERLYLAVAAISRDPAFYSDLGVPDSFEGRFDMLTLCAALALARLQELPPPADDLARDLADILFREFDRALRETGVGDIAVPKRMKTIASAFLGRAQAYAGALAGGPEPLDAVLLRNVFGGKAGAQDASLRLAHWVRASKAALAGAGLDAFVAGHPPFADLTLLHAEVHHGQD